MKQSGLKYLMLSFLILLAVAAMQTWHIEKLDSMVKIEIQNYSEKNLPITIKPERVEVTLVPLSISLRQTQFTPHAEIKNLIQPFSIETLHASPSLLHLLIGRIHIAKVEISGSKIEIAKTLSDHQEDFRIEFEKTLQSIPVTQIVVNNVSLSLKLKRGVNTITTNIQSIQTTLTNDINNLLVQLKLNGIDAQLDGTPVFEKSFFETHFFLTEKNLVLSDFKFKENASFIVASGSTQHSLKKKTLKNGKLNVRSFIDHKRIHYFYSLFVDNKEKNIITPLKGSLRSDLRFDFKSLEDFQIETKGSISNLEYEKFHIGDIDILGLYKNSNQVFDVEKIKIKNPGLEGYLSHSSLNIKDLTFNNADVAIDQFHLKKYLAYAIQKDIPADTHITTNAKCQGQLDPLKIECQGSGTAAQTLINPKIDTPILALEDSAKINGQLSISATDVAYKAQMELPFGRGSSQGTVHYKNGFEIEYSTPSLDLSKIKKISVLEIGGLAKIQGSTKGNSESATFELNLEGKDVLMQKYKLGELSCGLKYQSGSLLVNKIQGTVSSSRYLGNLIIDLLKEQITGRVQFPFIDLAVIQNSISENLKLPVAISGSGSAIVNIDGPLNPDKLSFKAKARLYNNKIGEQHIETADVDLTSTLGIVNFNTLILEEKNTQINIAGNMDLDRKEYNLTFNSQKLHLDDIIYAEKYSTLTRGVFTLTGKVSNSFKNPNLDLKFNSDNFYLANKKISPLRGDASIHSQKTTLEISGPNNLKFTFRNILSLPDYHIEGTTQLFDVAPLVTSFLDLKQIEDFKILATSNFNFKINRDQPSNINGYIFFPHLELNTEKSSLINTKNLSFFFSNGKLNFSPFSMEGTGGKLQFSANTNSNLPLDISLSGLFSLSFAHIFAPFLETVEGNTTVNFKIQKRDNKLEFYGSAFIDDGFLKLPDIQHAIENLKVDILFNQDRININSLKGKFASGQLVGDGNIRLIGAKNIPVELRIHLENVDLNIPPQVNTQGSGDFKLTGQWLPFKLSGVYQITDGLISKEFSGGDTNKQSAHEIFLPMALREEDKSPILLDLEINPLSPLKIKNALIDGKIQGKIYVTGAPQSPLLGGNISLTKFSQLIFKDVIFRVRDSNIGLSNTNPPNPTLYILADARYKGYDIEMLVQGTAEKPKFILSSQPTLTQPEIISLLALGYTTNEATNNTSINNSSMQVGTGVFGQNPLGKEFKNRFGVDVQFSSRFDTGSSVAVPTIGFSKQISEKTSFVGSVQTGKDSRADGKIRYELDRGFAATMTLQSQGREEANQLRGNNISDILGINLEFRKEFK